MPKDAPTSTRDQLLAAARSELIESGAVAVSLRAVARRAGLSHAAPAHFFGDRSGLLTAVAAEGFLELAAHLHTVRAASNRLAALGRAYVEFGAAHPALFDLMFRGTDLREQDEALQEAKRVAIEPLAEAISGSASMSAGDRVRWTLVSWSLVHGLVVLRREGMLTPFARQLGVGETDLVDSLVEVYARALPEA